MGNARLLPLLSFGLIFPLLGCDSAPERLAAEPVPKTSRGVMDAGSGRDASPPGPTEANGQSPIENEPVTGRPPPRLQPISGELPPLCATCKKPEAGGDTSDLGGEPLPCSGDVIAQDVVSLAQAREQGFDPDSLLKPLERVVDAKVRWDFPGAPAQTDIRIEFASDGTAIINRWQDKPDSFRPPCRKGDFLSVNLRISISTSDSSVEGSVVINAGPGPASDRTIRYEYPGGAVQSTRVVADATSFRGTLDLGTPNGDEPSITAWLELETGLELEPRIVLSMYLDHMEQRGTERVRVHDNWAEAYPLDGCHAVRYPHDGPIENSDCSKPRFGSGCCVLTWVLFAPPGIDGGFDRDVDAGFPL